MAVPTITSITPASGPALGRNLVEIVGTNFNLPPPVTGTPVPYDFRVTADAARSVDVLFDAELCPLIEVVSATLLRVWPPAYRGDSNQDTFLAVTITITNIDTFGNPILGETVTSLPLYTYQRTGLIPPDVTTTPFESVTRELLRTYKRAVIKNVSHSTHTDYAEFPYTTLLLADVPSLHFVGPRVSHDPEFTHNEFSYRGPEDAVEVFDPPMVYQLEYDILGISDSQVELQGLMAATREVPERAGWLVMDNPLGGDRLKHWLQSVEDPKEVGGPSDANLRVFSSTVRVRGVSVYFSERRDLTATVEEVQQEISDEEGEII